MTLALSCMGMVIGRAAVPCTRADSSAVLNVALSLLAGRAQLLPNQRLCSQAYLSEDGTTCVRLGTICWAGAHVRNL
jgi:hypothetical protein